MIESSHHIGFTGSRIKPTTTQEVWLKLQLQKARTEGFDTLHHGDCIGGDALAHKIALSFDFQVVIHPPLNPRYRAYCTEGTHWIEMTYRERNACIVAASQLMLALPSGSEQAQPRSGTWMTVRMARQVGVPLVIWKN